MGITINNYRLKCLIIPNVYINIKNVVELNEDYTIKYEFDVNYIINKQSTKQSTVHSEHISFNTDSKCENLYVDLYNYLKTDYFSNYDVYDN